MRELAVNSSEKLIVLRHDVDNIWSIYKSGIKGRGMKILNYSLMLFPSTTIRQLLPNYLDTVLELVDLEKDYGATSTFFFRVCTAPTKRILNELLKSNCEIGYHSDRNRSFEEFYRDLLALKRMVGYEIFGFTKHGYSPVRSGGPWDEAKFIEYGVKAKLKYLAQGEGHPDWEYPKVIRGLLVFGHHITLKKCSKEQVKEYVERRKVPLILVHPEDLSIPGIKEMFEELLTMGRGVSVINFLSYADLLQS